MKKTLDQAIADLETIAEAAEANHWLGRTYISWLTIIRLSLKSKLAKGTP